MAQSCSNVMYCCVPLAPFALNRSSPLPGGKASMEVLQVVGVSWATPPPQMPLKSGRVCAQSEPGSIAHADASTAAAASCGRDCDIAEILEGVVTRRLIRSVPTLLCNAVFVDETDLHVFAVRKRECIGESIVGARAVRIIVDLVGLADHEQAPVAQAQPPQSVRADGFGCPLLDCPILFLHIEVEPGVGVDPVDFRQDADEAFLLVDIELGLHRVMGLRRRRDKQSNTEQSDEKGGFVHGSSVCFDQPEITVIPVVFSRFTGVMAGLVPAIHAFTT